MRSVKLAGFVLALLMTTSCSLRSIAIGKLGDALASEGEVFAADDDPDLVGDALPFSLKLIESLLAESPRHPGLLLAATRGFTQYSYGWVEQPASERDRDDPAAAARLRSRAARLYLRARDYGLRGLDAAHPGFASSLRADAKRAVSALKASDVPIAYWTAASWGLAISLSKEQPELVADLPLVEAMIDRALQLDESFGKGAIHSFLIAYEPNRNGAEGDPFVRSRKHFDRAVELSQGKLASPFVTFAESIDVQMQNRAEFESLLQRALAVDPDAEHASRLENRIAQRHAQWLLAHADDLFLDSKGEVK
jgi:predicted anti-sigma-YlaC factor YlaD